MSELQVWHLTSSRWECGDYIHLVTAEERLRAERFRFENDAGRFLASWALVRAALGRALSVSPMVLMFDRLCQRCGTAGHGKPSARLPDGSVPTTHFSLTRAGCVVAVAVGRRPVGLDAEPARAGIEEFVDAPVFSAEEQRWIREGRPPAMAARVLRVWVAKEAVGKASGLGLEGADKVVTPLVNDGWRRATDAHGQRCWLAELDIPSAAAAAVATYGPAIDIQVADARALDLPSR